MSLIQKINPQSKNYTEALQLLKTINAKVVSDEQEKKRKEEEYEKKQQELINEANKQQDEMEKFRINAYKEIALEYAKHQPAVIYKNIYWR